MQMKNLFTKQKMMRTVLLSLVPVTLAAVFLFGWRVIPLMAVAIAAACISEYVVMRTIQKEKTKISEAALVSAVLLTLTLPPDTPFWVAVIGIVFGIVFGKTVFGGFGRNIFNPALVGRCFIYIAFPAQMTMLWPQPFMSLPGGFAAWAPMATDAISSVTPLIALGKGMETPGVLNMLLGFVSGSLGETSAILIALCGVYLVYRKVASWQIMVSTVLSAFLLAAALYLTGVSTAGPVFTILSGGLMFGAVFMATDPISAPKAVHVQWVYGILIGAATVIIRVFGLFTEGMMFAILIANALTPLMELKYKQLIDKARKKTAEVAA